MSDSIHRLATQFQERIEGVETDFNNAYWVSQIEASPENDRARADLELELRKIMGDAEALERVNAALAEGIHDPVLKRQLEILRLGLTGNQMTDAEREEIVELSTQVESEFANHRAEIDGEKYDDNKIDEVLQSSDDPELRKRVWQASKEVGSKVAERVRELVRARNATARKLGYGDYYQMSLDLEELPEEWLFGVMDELERLTDEPFAAWKSQLDERLVERFGTTDLFPWHYADPFFQQLPPDGRLSLDDLFGEASAEALALDTFRRWDIDLTSVMANSDLYPRDRKCQHAFCIDVDRKKDVRMLCNVVPGERWIDTMLHESGHAAYDIFIDHKLPYLLRQPAHTFVTEAIALMSGALVRDPDWLKQVAGFSADQVDPLAKDLHAATAASELLFSRWGLVMVHFERDLYADPEGDLDERWWRYVERFQKVRVPEGAAPVGAWASKIHIAAAPVYYQNYLLGNLLAAQLVATARDEFGGVVGVPEAGRMLKERIFKHGCLYPWSELIVKATGRELGATDFAAQMAV